MAQTQYADMERGQAGDIAYYCGGNNPLVLSYNVVTGGLIKPGLGIAKIAADQNGIKLPDSSSVQFLGVATRDTSEENTEDESFAYAANSMIGGLRRGQIWVSIDQSVTPDDPVFVRFASEVEVFTITWDGDFVADNNIDGSILGVAIATVPFDTDQATTLANVAAAIQALASVDTASATGLREITVTGINPGELLSASATFTVTGGLSQADEVVASVSGPSTGTQLGAFRIDDDDVGSGALALALPNCKFLTDGSASGIALLDLNIS